MGTEGRTAIWIAVSNRERIEQVRREMSVASGGDRVTYDQAIEELLARWDQTQPPARPSQFSSLTDD